MVALPMSKRKSADANDLGVDDLKQVRLRACVPCKQVCGPEKMLQCCVVSKVGLVGIFCQV